MNLTLDITQIEKYSKEELTILIQYLINNDLPKLIYLLYRVDVSENTIKKLLNSTNEENTDVLITNAIIERIKEKTLFRQNYKSNLNNSDEEKW